MTIDKAKKTALLLIEYQNDFANPNGVFYEAVKPVMDASGMLENTQDLVVKARALGVHILFCPITFTADYHEMNPQIHGILKAILEKQAFQQGSWGAEIIEQLPVKETDIVIEGKRGLSGFYSTNLDFILRQLKIETLAVAGFLTNCCVEATLRTGYEKGFDTVALTDCTAATSAEEQQFSVTKNFPMFSRPLPYQDFLTELTSGNRTDTSGGGYAG